MNRKVLRLNLIIILLISAITPLLGQVVYDLNFQGVLKDIEGNRMANEGFDLYVQLKKASGSDTLFDFTSATTTDPEGWFGFNISEISRFLNDDQPFSVPLQIRMEFLPKSSTTWIKEGSDFELSYTLSSKQGEESKTMEMTRMEGSKLLVHAENQFHAFKDQYPFAYITGGFLLTDQPPLDKELIDDLKQWILPENTEDEGAVSRGVKGGFPTGGYYRKK